VDYIDFRAVSITVFRVESAFVCARMDAAARPSRPLSFWKPYGMLRSAASPGSVGFGRPGGGVEWPPHTAPPPAGHL